ncbi:hypothetical protein CDAR_71801 [Caerostris darwini]|uniref:Secreted protein n=1 Tax=Caerostris darwini TaxID=1538125 RepID=A0AAV4TH36_9ARAC|nr:hypothetical protein CDAR_71801 [Caerostris darwini]
MDACCSRCFATDAYFSRCFATDACFNRCVATDTCHSCCFAKDTCWSFTSQLRFSIRTKTISFSFFPRIVRAVKVRFTTGNPFVPALARIV